MNLFRPSPCAGSGQPNLVNQILSEQHTNLTLISHSYFSQYALEEVYLKDERFAKYINRELLKDYYPVGGIRIEDDILVTKNGYENLTTAPKGKKALDIINKEVDGMSLPW